MNVNSPDKTSTCPRLIYIVFKNEPQAFNNFKYQTRMYFPMSRILAAQLSGWLCLATESLSEAEGPAGVLVHPAATPSYTQREREKSLSSFPT